MSTIDTIWFGTINQPFTIIGKIILLGRKLSCLSLLLYKPTMNKGALITIAFLLLVASISIDLLWTGNKFQCEVCIKYKDQIVCQKVKGMEKQDTIMTGISTACAAVADGMTESIECQAQPLEKMKCQGI